MEVNGNEEQQLIEVARRLKVRAEDLAAAAVQDLLAEAEEDFQSAAARVLKKNRGLYCRHSAVPSISCSEERQKPARRTGTTNTPELTESDTTRGNAGYHRWQRFASGLADDPRKTPVPAQ